MNSITAVPPKSTERKQIRRSETKLIKNSGIDSALRATNDAGTPPPVSDVPDIFTALQEQLGLRLEKGTGPVEYLVIDHVEKPLAN